MSNTFFPIKTREQILDMVAAAPGSPAEKAMVGYEYVTTGLDQILEDNKAILEEEKEFKSRAEYVQSATCVNSIAREYVFSVGLLEEVKEYSELYAQIGASDYNPRNKMDTVELSVLQEEFTYLVTRANTFNAIKEARSMKSELYAYLNEEQRATLSLEKMVASK
jgi:hypothetical protein